MSYDPDLHTWDADTARIERDDEVDSSCPECSSPNVTRVVGALPVCRDCDWTGWLCPEWGDVYRYEEQETWDHRIVIGCNCGHTPPKDDDDPR